MDNYNKDSLVFSDILKKEKLTNSNDKQSFDQKEEVVSNASQYGSKIQRKKTIK